MFMKGLAVEQIIMLAIGVIVLALIGYLIYSQFVKSGSNLTSANCQSDIGSACTKCKTCILGFGGVSWDPSVNCPQCPTSWIGWGKCNTACTVPAGCTISNTALLANGFLGPQICSSYGFG